jgi:hypothetical protein
LRSRNNRGAAATIILAYSMRLPFQPTSPSEGGAHRSQLGSRQGVFSNARIDSHGYRATNDQSEFSKAPRASKNRTARFARHLQRRIFDRRHCALRSHDVQHPSCSKRIASFLCGRRFLRQFSSRHDAARAVRAESGISFHTRQNNVVRNLPQMFLIAAGNEARV